MERADQLNLEHHLITHYLKISALSLGRHAYMVDVNPEAEPIIKERLAKAQADGIIPIEDDTNDENSKKKKKNKDKKSKMDPNQKTLDI